MPPGLRELPTLIDEAWPAKAWRDLHVVLAVSGGPDSVALLRAMSQIKTESGGRGELFVAHYNHGVRGEQSGEDAQWVEQLVSGMGLECVVGESEHTGERSEEQLRNERRAFYVEAAKRFAARHVVTAHSAEDQAETVLFRLLRGSGLAGLRGIAPVSRLSGAVTLVRPLLRARRTQIQSYLDGLAQTYRTDPTNIEDGPTRNWIRNRLLPEASERFGGGVVDSLLKVSDQANEAYSVLEALARDTAQRSRVERLSEGEGIRVLCEPLVESPYVGRETLRMLWREAGLPEQEMTARHWGALQALAASGNGESRQSFPGGVMASSDGERLELARSGAGAKIS